MSRAEAVCLWGVVLLTACLAINFAVTDDAVDGIWWLGMLLVALALTDERNT